MRTFQRNYLIVWLLPALLIFSACKRECTYVCSETDFGITISGFNEIEIDTVIIRGFSANGNFNDLLSYSEVYNVYYHGLGRFSPTMDWEFYIPSTKKTYRFSEITRQGKTTEKGDCKTTKGCINEVASFRLNGQEIKQSFGSIDK